MKSSIIVFPGIFIFGVTVAVVAVMKIGYEDMGVAGGVLLVIGALAIAWVAATLLNVALFAPVYWILGRSASKKARTQKPHGHDTL